MNFNWTLTYWRVSLLGKFPVTQCQFRPVLCQCFHSSLGNGFFHDKIIKFPFSPHWTLIRHRIKENILKTINCGLLSILVMEPEMCVFVVLRMEKGHQWPSSLQPKVCPFEKFVFKIKYCSLLCVECLVKSTWNRPLKSKVKSLVFHFYTSLLTDLDEHKCIWQCSAWSWSHNNASTVRHQVGLHLQSCCFIEHTPRLPQGLISCWGQE